MSNITTIYDGLVARATTLYPNHDRIPQPYDLSTNKTVDLVKAWGLKYVNRIIANSQNTKKLTKTYIFSMVFTREMYRLPGDEIPLDTTVKDLLEDDATWTLDAYDPLKMGLGSAAQIIRVDQADGIFSIFEDTNNYLAIESFISITTQEVTLNC